MCHMMAITVLVDTPLSLLLMVREPPPIPVPVSQQRFLSQLPEWPGPSPRYDYSLVAPLQPGINHVTWCKRAVTGVEMSFFPPAYGDWPTISPYPITPHHELKFFSYQSGNHLRDSHYTQVSYRALSSHPLSSCKQPHTLAIYSLKGTVHSLFLMATLSVIGMGYLRPDWKDRQLLPHRMTDETYHFVKLTDFEGTAIH
jgi:hypothetical protein